MIVKRDSREAEGPINDQRGFGALAGQSSMRACLAAVLTTLGSKYPRGGFFSAARLCEYEHIRFDVQASSVHFTL